MEQITERYELEAWLGDDHGLNDEQITELMQISDEIEQRYPEDFEDDRESREAALTVAYRLMVEDPEDVVHELSAELWRARIAQARALAGLRQGALTLVEPGSKGARGIRTQQGYAERAAVTRMTVRDWLGLR
jgi:hypothetical protein